MREISFFLLVLLVHHTQTAAPQRCNQTLNYVHCPQTWMSLRSDMECRCKINCRGLLLTCLNNGRLERTDFDEYCSVEYKNEEHTRYSGEKLKVSFVKNNFTLKCMNSLTTETGSAYSCNANGISVTKYPVCQLIGPTIPRLPVGGCKAFEFRCYDGQCIDLYLRCDGDRDCTDGSDEQLCGTKQMLAFPERFRCRSNARSLPLDSRCNNVYWGCLDRSDEHGCSPGVCGVHQYRCANGKCIPGEDVCNEYNECGDSSDEIYCSHFTKRGRCPAWNVLCNINRCRKGNFGCNAEVCTDSTQAQMCKGKCKRNEGQCENSKCIPLTYFCDGDNDCGDNSDERNCNSQVCPRNEFYCDNGMCVPMSAKCDGINHCGDGSDEWGCPKPPGGCKQCEFSCVRTGQCVPWVARCDGLFHCTDGSDEWADACKADIPAGCSDTTSNTLSTTSSTTLYNIFKSTTPSKTTSKKVTTSPDQTIRTTTTTTSASESTSDTSSGMPSVTQQDARTTDTSDNNTESAPRRTFATATSSEIEPHGASTSDVPPCQTSPAGLNCGADEFVPHNESRICSCSNTCRRVEITCLTNGSWSQYNEQCSKPLQKCSNTVATCFTNGKYKFKCANGFKQISGNSTVVCDNGLLKFSEKLRCEKIIIKEMIGLGSTTSWAVVVTSLLLFSILYIAIGIYIYRKDERMFAAFEQNDPKVVDEPSASTSTAV